MSFAPVDLNDEGRHNRETFAPVAVDQRERMTFAPVDRADVESLMSWPESHDIYGSEHHHLGGRRKNSMRLSQKVTFFRSDEVSDWRKKLGEIMESRPVEICIVVLVIVEVICVSAEVLHYLDILIHNAVENSVFHVLFMVSIAILFLMLTELVLKMIAFGSLFWGHFWHLFDLFIVTSALILETIEAVVLHHRREDAVEDKAPVPWWLFALSIVVILCRLVRIVLGFFEVQEYTIKRQHHKIQKVLEEKDEEIALLQAENVKYRTASPSAKLDPRSNKSARG